MSADSPMPWWPWLLFALVVAAVFVGRYLERRRHERIQMFAAQRSLTYAARDDRWVRINLGHPHGEGRSHKGKHVMTGVHEGRPIAIFEHEWVTSSGKESATHTAHVTLMELPRSFPMLDVRPEGMFGRTARRLGFRDIELESEHFNQQFRVVGDRRLAYDVLNPRFMEWLMQLAAPGFTMHQNYVGFTANGKVDLNEVDAYIAYLDQIVDRLPSYVIGG